MSIDLTIFHRFQMIHPSLLEILNAQFNNPEPGFEERVKAFLQRSPKLILMLVDFIKINLQPSPLNPWLELIAKNHEPLVMRSQVQTSSMKSGMVKFLVLKFFPDTIRHLMPTVLCHRLLVLKRTVSKYVNTCFDTHAEKTSDAVARGDLSFAASVELMKMGHVKTVQRYTWDMMNGRKGLAEDIDQAKKIALCFPRYATTPGFRWEMRHWTGDIKCSFDELSQAEDPQSKYEMAMYYNKRYEREDMCEIEFLRNHSKLLKEAADAGLPEAQYLLASDIWWEDRDFDVCLDLLKKAASKGHEYSMELVNRSSKENKKIPFPQW
jgi:hypothetical protein